MKGICESQSSLYFDKYNFYKKYINNLTKEKKEVNVSFGMTRSL